MNLKINHLRVIDQILGQMKEDGMTEFGLLRYSERDVECH